MNILITGANGFIGSNLCRYFLKKSYSVYGLVRKTSDLHFLEDVNIKLIFGDLIEVEKIEFPKNLDFIIHSASCVRKPKSFSALEEEKTKRFLLLRARFFDQMASDKASGNCN